MTSVHATAIVDRSAELADDVVVGPFSIVGPGCAIGAGTVVGPHAVIAARTRMGRRNRVFQFASIGEIAQDRKYGGEPTTTTIGDGNVFREYVTVHAGTAQDRGDTAIGDDNLFLAYTHVAHDCVVGSHTVFSNNAQIAGHVRVDDWVVMGAYGGVHQFCRIGAHAMVAAGSIVLQDVPPFTTVQGYPAAPKGTNAEGLKRRGFTPGDMLAIRRAYKALYREGLALDEARAAIAAAAQDAPVLAPLVAFLAEPGRGLVR
ncbi:MAG: acyl-ACP--UDP-N-acetylglucosamine O-acyltransferase [Betaproteobacteria bacterium]|jgi:UDP-N-acetylglucosamine acyltransferase|nr:acyl-ACP--UDP-N-acetylglucosamine O-acyltransferase [Betaproteobacteria bacterium]MDH5288259.1 acyl-ACP--UDP-N-acetylglucosamine O-acyltransferase [Betaproteobacteria bacterium]